MISGKDCLYDIIYLNKMLLCSGEQHIKAQMIAFVFLLYTFMLVYFIPPSLNVFIKTRSALLTSSDISRAKSYIFL